MKDHLPHTEVHWIRYVIASFIVLALATYIGAILGGWIAAERRLDANSIILIVLAAGISLLVVNPSWIEGLASISLGGFKAEFARLQNRQELQQQQVNSVSAVLAMLLTDDEQNQILRIKRGQTRNYQGNHDLRDKLRKLRGMRLIQMNKDPSGAFYTMGAIKDYDAAKNNVSDLSTYLSLTELGERIGAELERVEREKATLSQQHNIRAGANSAV